MYFNKKKRILQNKPPYNLHIFNSAWLLKYIYTGNVSNCLDLDEVFVCSFLIKQLMLKNNMFKNK